MARILPIAIVGLALVLYALWRGAYPDLFEDTEPPPPAGTAMTPATPPSEKAPAEARTPPSASETLPATPQLDVVRIDEDGDTVIAGKAEPGASVTIATQDGPLATVKADERGNWVALPEKPLPAGDHAVTIESTGKDGKTEVGDKTIVVSIAEEAGVKPLVVAVPTKDFGASEVIQRPELPPGADEPAGIGREPPAGAPPSPEKPAVLAEAPKETAPPAPPVVARPESQRTAATGEGETQGRETGAPPPTVAKAPISGERAAAPPAAATRPGRQQAVGSGAPSSEAREGGESRAVAKAPGKPEEARTAAPQDAAAGQTAATGEDASGRERAPAPAAIASATPDKAQPSAVPSRPAEQRAGGAAPDRDRARERPAPAAESRAASSGTAAPAPAASAEVLAASEEERTEARSAAESRAASSGTAAPAPAASAEAPAASEEERTEARSAAESRAAPPGTAAPAPAAVAEAPIAPDGGQAKAGAPPKPGGVSVDSVDYDDRGNLALSGTAKPGSVVEPKIAGAEAGSQSLGEAKADETGAWRLKVERSVAPGRYRLTVEERSPEGAPRSRISLPFERANPIADFPPGDIVVVQPGNSLWRIARRVYGQGVRYTVIYAANRAQIGDPDLIFPGQIFSVPQEALPGRVPG